MFIKVYSDKDDSSLNMQDSISLKIQDTNNSLKDYNSSLKLLKHLDKLSEWDKTGDTYPVAAAVDLTNACNQKCPLCMGARPDNNAIPFEKVKDIIMQLKEVGVKAIGLGGGGDPSAHPKLADIVRFIKAQGMDVGIYSNCQMLSDDTMDAIISCCTYLRVSLDADNPQTYKKTHGMEERAFYAVIENIKKLVSLKQKLNKPITIGGGYLVGPHTINGIYNAVKLYKELGLDYIRIRPFFDGTGADACTEENIIAIEEQLQKCLELRDKSFSVTFPTHRIEWLMKGYHRERPFKKCYIHHFETVITANQKLYPCCHLSGNDEYCYGDLKVNTFKEIWSSPKRKEAYENIDFRDCPNPCMYDASCRLLWEMKAPILHSNFV